MRAARWSRRFWTPSGAGPSRKWPRWGTPTRRDQRPINIELGLRRANAVRSLLITAGVDAIVIEVSSHGEADLLVKTADEVLEPRNRRVDITVR